MTKENKKILITGILLLCFALVITGVYCIYSTNKRQKEETINIVLNEGALNINYIDGDKVQFSDAKEHEYVISVTNNGVEKIYYSLTLMDFYSSKEVEVEVKEEDKNSIYKEKIQKEDVLFSLHEISSGETKRYYITIKGNHASVEGKLKITNDSISTQTFSDLLLLNNSVTIATTRPASTPALEEEGLIPMQDKDGTSYYFRGNVENNYVALGDIMFRVVRINGNGSVRIVLDSLLENAMPFTVNPIEEGSSAASLADLNKASILNTLNAWYEGYLGNYKNNIVSGDFCYDTEFNTLSGSFNRSSSYIRVFADYAPSLYCNNGTYTGKVGLLSVDEVALAGGAANQENRSYYLNNDAIISAYYLSNANYITANNEVMMLTVLETGSISEGALSRDALGIRPVINLSVSAKVKGKGTKENPYIIVS